ncbi:hypothetical protein H2200_001289 [Cladophialophora chaetospira]|uniref:SnoaL-like domain-containing protein n=1 Tax=Cladophialophora chaetospira TaxID=386627 RepID=A0AA38XLE0_9EURO|nr:hypothetical protein H2200_001289 [Cladophialophora chaetospira]
MSAQTLTQESAEHMAREWFSKVDVLDVDATVSLCDEESVVTFGNNPSIQGVTNLREMFGGFYQYFDKMNHDIRNISVGYYIKGKKDESPVVVPVMSVMRLKSGSAGGQMRFKDFRVYIDLSPVMAMVQS